MSLNVNGFSVLAAIAANSDVFEGLKDDATEAAIGLVQRLLKAKSTDLAKVRDLHRVLGAHDFRLIVEDFKDAPLNALLKKLDQHRAKVEGDNVLRRRQHLCALAHGLQEPAPKPTKPGKPAKTTKGAARPAAAKKSSKAKVAPPADGRGPLDYVSAGRSAGKKNGR
jgi:hypothetical protein